MDLTGHILLILSRKLFMDPEKLVAFVHHTDETAEAGVFRFEQGVEFAQGGVFSSAIGLRAWRIRNKVTKRNSRGWIRRVNHLFKPPDAYFNYQNSRADKTSG